MKWFFAILFQGRGLGVRILGQVKKQYADILRQADAIFFGAVGTKLNIPVPPFADDSVFQSVWPQIEAYLQINQPEFILLQCGADSIEGNPITNMAFSPASHAYAAKRLCALADQYCDGKFLAMGGGGYNLDNIARAWTAVVDAMVKAD